LYILKEQNFMKHISLEHAYRFEF